MGTEKIIPMKPKHPEQSKTVMTDLVLPSDTNPINNLFGGELLARMDRAACIAAQRHSEQIVVTASVNHVHFRKPVPLGSVLTLEAKYPVRLARLWRCLLMCGSKHKTAPRAKK